MTTNISFFMEQPANRIIYRLSYDQMILDDKLNESIHGGLESMLFIFGGMLIMNYVYYGIFFILSIFIFVYLYHLLKNYLKVTTVIIQQREKTRAKLMSTYMKSLESLIIFRGIGKSKIFEKEFNETNDLYQNCNSHIGNYCQRWLGVRIAFFNATMILICMFLPYITIKYFSFMFGEDLLWKIPLGLTWSYKVVLFTSNFISQLAKIANDMLSTKRLEEFYNIEDPYNQKKGLKKYKEFKIIPGTFAIDINNLDLTIHGNCIFRNLNLKIRQNERVAIIGPSGSGKHSLFKIILGLYKPDNVKSKMEPKEKKKEDKSHFEDLQPKEKLINRTGKSMQRRKGQILSDDIFNVKKKPKLYLFNKSID